MSDANPDLHNARIDWLEDGTPWSADFDDVYFSRAGGLDETRHVFLDGNDLARRWKRQDRPGGVFTIAELGFGTGLNFLACWRLWQQTACRHLRLHYISCERRPLTRRDLAHALDAWPELQAHAEALLVAYPEQGPGIHRLHLGGHDGLAPVMLDLYYGDALTILDARPAGSPGVDAWFLDGFSPRRNPDLWQEALLSRVASLSNPDATLASYSVTGRVVRTLRELNFTVERRPGFAGKRHMLTARYMPGTSAASAAPTATDATNQAVAIIGAGLAGATAAWSLARRGWQVDVYDAAGEAASGASGNPQAVLQCRLNRLADAQWQLNLQAFLHAARFYDWLQEQGIDIGWQRCGVLVLDSAYARTRRPPDPDSYGHYPDSVLKRVDRLEATRLSGLTVTEGGLFLTPGGWLDPARLCRQLLEHPGITLHSACQVSRIERNGKDWLLRDRQGAHVTSAANVIIANGHAAREFELTKDLPLLPLRGQVSYLPATGTTRSLASVICGRSYLIPANNDGWHCVGASYHKNCSETRLWEQDNASVMAGIRPFVPAVEAGTARPIPGRAAVRASSGDFMPLVGNVPDPQAWTQTGNGQSDHGTDYLAGLYISSGHGSHGLASCPLAGEQLASLITGDMTPLDADTGALLDPWRFIARHRRRQAGRRGQSPR